MSNPYNAPHPEETNVDPSAWKAESKLTVAEAADVVQEYFFAQKYRRESGDAVEGVYGIGSDILRFLFGVFCKRYKFRIRVVANRYGGSDVFVDKAMSGAMGGVLGYAKMNNELQRIRTEIQQLWPDRKKM